MSSRRTGLVLLLLVGSMLGACGGGGGSNDGGASPSPDATNETAPSAGPSAPATSPSADASPAGGAPGGPGTFTVTVGDKTGTGVLTECTMSNGTLTANNIGDTSDDTIVVVIPPTGMPIISGTVDGIDFALGLDGTGTTDGKTGSFSGSDGGTNEPISGSFTCP